MNQEGLPPGMGRPGDVRGLSLKGILGTVASGIGKFAPGPSGLLLREVGRRLGGRRGPARPIPMSPGQGVGRSFGPTIINTRGGTSGRTVPAPPLPTQARENAAAIGLVCPPGMIPNKSRYTLQSGETVEPGTRCVTRRTMNVGNAKALRRGIRRTAGFAKLAKRALAGSNFKVVSARTSARPRRSTTIRESGPGNVTVG